VNRRTGRNPVGRVLAGYTEVAFDDNREIAVGQWGCSQSAVLALKLQMLWSAGDNLNDAPVRDRDGGAPGLNRGRFVAAGDQQNPDRKCRDDKFFSLC
jgi:hypothetical protein